MHCSYMKQSLIQERNVIGQLRRLGQTAVVKGHFLFTYINWKVILFMSVKTMEVM